MENVAGIRFVEAGPISYCAPGDLEIGIGDYVVVRTDRGERLGWVVVTPDQVVSATLEGPLRVIERLASADDIEAHRSQKRRAEEDIGRAQHAAARIDPRVRVASLVYDLAGARGDLGFTAREGSDLSDRLRREIGRELDVDVRVQQVGDRDRAKATGAIDVCGRVVCCSSWMTEFPAISIKMAKDQGLAPNPSKISGVCGRLLCCLSFEIEAYREVVGTLPKVGKRVTTPIGGAKVLSINALSETVRLRLDETGEVIEISAELMRKQMGSAIRPEELQQEFETALHAKDRDRRENLLAILDPIDRPALRDAEPTDGSMERDRTQPRPRPDRGERSERRPRRAPSSPEGGADRGDRPQGGTRTRPGLPGIARRRRAGTAPDASSPRTGEGEPRAARRRPASPPPSGDANAAPPGGGTDGEQKRRRRRGRRGGRGRGGAGGAGGEGAAE
ncbi:MAG: regulatory iron-sulfur-containing complex subunit RicT [Acidimicrobiia bacterium]